MALAVSNEKDTSEEWRELESDPGLFSLLVEEFGVKGVKVQEVYDVSAKIQGKVYGYVFLFRYEHGGDRRARKKARDMASEGVSYVLEPQIVNNMFYAHQIIVNSCATHALLSVLLNCPEIQLGPSLTRLKAFSAGLDPESKGFAIANLAELSVAHNKFAKPTVVLPRAGRAGAVVSSAHSLLPETFHFVSYVPINGRLFELDGLKEYPIDHGPWGEHEDWTDLFQRIISSRLARSENFLFNLMAVIPDPISKLSERLKSLCDKQEQFLQDTVDWATKLTTSEEAVKEDEHCGEVEVPGKLVQVEELAKAIPSEKQIEEVATMQTTSSCDDLRKSIAQVLMNEVEIKSSKQKLKEHLENAQQYQIEHARRVHDYEPFITAFIKILAQNNRLPQRIMKATVVKSVNAGHVQKRPKRRSVDCRPKNKTTLLVNGNKVAE